MPTVLTFCKQHRRVLLLCLTLLLVSAALLSLFCSRYALSVSRHTLDADITATVRIVHLSDLHGAVFGDGNSRLIGAIQKEAPDLILITGDTVNAWEPDVTNMTALLARLAEIAPVYLSLGNHELTHTARYRSDFTRLWGESVTVLDFSADTFEINGVRIAVGGLYGYCSVHPEDKRSAEHIFLDRFAATDADVHLLLSHLPLCWINGTSASHWNTLTAVFCGHNHGGQIRIPLLGGAYAPDMGYFPGRVSGVFTQDNAVPVFVSRGLGSGTYVPRFRNPPQITVLDLIPTS